jgi:hypothetical protein
MTTEQEIEQERQKMFNDIMEKNSFPCRLKERVLIGLREAINTQMYYQTDKHFRTFTEKK